MKQCPRCRRAYPDETLNFCLDDGAWLVDPATADESPTALLSSSGDFALRDTAGTLTHGSAPPPHDTADAPAAGTVARPRGSKRLAVIVTICAAVLGIAGAAWVYRRSSGPEGKQVSFQTAKLTRLTSSGKVTTAAISPDGKYVAHVVDDGGQQSVWIRQTATPSNVQIVPPGEMRLNGLAFTPDGNFVYYTVSDDTEPDGALYQVAVLGGPAKRVLRGITSAVAFSKDGQRIAWVRDSFETEELVVANADGKGERVIATRSGDDGFLGGSLSAISWSPDGKLVATPLRSYSQNYTTVATVPSDGGELDVITEKKWFTVKQLAWMADGASILAAGAETSTTLDQLWQISIADRQTRRITNDLNGYRTVSLTADSDALATVLAERTSGIWVAPANDAARGAQVISGRGFVQDIVWTPDGKLIYGSTGGGNFDLFLADPRPGGAEKQLTADTLTNRDPSISADGTRVAFMSDRTGPPQIWRMNPDGSDQRQLTSEAYNLRPQISPDGTWIIYVSTQKGGWDLWRIPYDGGEPVQITQHYSDYPAVSPDGKLVACYYREKPQSPRVIGVFSTDPVLQPHPLKTFPLSIPTGRETNLDWTPDGKSIVYGSTRGGVSNLWAQPLEGGPQKQITNFTADRIFWFDFSRDGKQIALARGTVSNDVLLVKGL